MIYRKWFIHPTHIIDFSVWRSIWLKPQRTNISVEKKWSILVELYVRWFKFPTIWMDGQSFAVLLKCLPVWEWNGFYSPIKRLLRKSFGAIKLLPRLRIITRPHRPINRCSILRHLMNMYGVLIDCPLQAWTNCREYKTESKKLRNTFHAEFRY